MTAPLMTDPLATGVPLDQVQNLDSKVRHCLRCRVEFRSQWAGERVCSRCKGTSAWRQGSPMRSQFDGG